MSAWIKMIEDEGATGTLKEMYDKVRAPNGTVDNVMRAHSLRPRTIDQLVGGMPLVFQRNKSQGVDATYHFTFTGDEQRQVTFVIRDQTFPGSYVVPQPVIVSFHDLLRLELEFAAELCAQACGASAAHGAGLWALV